MPRAADQKRVLAACLENILQTFLDLVHDLKEWGVHMTCVKKHRSPFNLQFHPGVLLICLLPCKFRTRAIPKHDSIT